LYQKSRIYYYKEGTKMDQIRIVAVIGNESHTTSSGWAKLFINGERASHRDAISKQWLTKYGDRHASWCECVFEITDDTEIRWQAGANSGSRGRNRTRIDKIFRADSTVAPIQIESPGYPAQSATLRGRLVEVVDAITESAANHEALKNAL
jgi:hypothetical protein